MTSLRQRLQVAMLVSGFVLLGLFTVIVFVVTRAFLIEHFDDIIETQALAIAAVTHREEGRHVVDVGSALLEIYETRDYFTAWTLDGTEIARAPPDEPPFLEFDELPLDEHDRSTWEAPLPDGRDGRWLCLVAPLRVDGTSDEEIVVAVGTHQDAVELWIAGLLHPLLLAGGLLGLGLVVAVQRSIDRGLAPIDDIASEIEGLGPGRSVSRLSTTERPSELQPLVSRLDDLVTRLDQALERERRTTADIAHELRTPIAELRSLTDVALKWEDHDYRRQALDGSRTIAVRMEAIVSSLLTLSRVQQGALTTNAERFDLVELVTQCRDDEAERAAEREMELELLLPDTLLVTADPDIARIIVSNLLGNAVAHGVPGHEVTCRIDTDGERPALVIANRHEGLTKADLAVLTEPFWTKDAARSDRDHAGLGSTLASELAALLDWETSFALEGPTFRATLTLSSNSETQAQGE